MSEETKLVPPLPTPPPNRRIKESEDKPIIEEDEDDVDPKLAAAVPNLAKLLSGKFILTIVGAICFYLFSDTVCDILIAKQQELKASEMISILSTLLVVVSNIFTFYFVRKSISGNGQPGQE
jgi:hypothetical protein